MFTKLYEDPNYNQSFADAWSLAHIATGVAGALLNVPPVVFISLQLAYEVAEQGLERRYLKRPESALNVLGDITFATMAYLATQYVQEHR